MKVLSVIVLLIVTGVDSRTFSNSHCADFKTAVEGKPDKYIEIVHMMPKERDCPPGTHFEQRTCECSLLLLDTPKGTTVHGGVGNNMHHDPPGLQGTTGIDAGIPNEFAHLPTKVLVELLNQEQAKSQQQQDYIPQPTVTTVTPGNNHWPEFTLPQSGASASFNHNQLVIRVPMNRKHRDSQFDQHYDPFMHETTPTVPFDQFSNQVSHGLFNQHMFTLPTTTSTQMTTPSPPSTTTVVQHIVKIPDNVGIPTVKPKIENKFFDAFLEHFQANVIPKQNKEVMHSNTAPKIQSSVKKISSFTSTNDEQIQKPRIVTFPQSDVTTSTLPSVEVPLPPQSFIKKKIMTHAESPPAFKVNHQPLFSIRDDFIVKPSSSPKVEMPPPPSSLIKDDFRGKPRRFTAADVPLPPPSSLKDTFKTKPPRPPVIEIPMQASSHIRKESIDQLSISPTNKISFDKEKFIETFNKHILDAKRQMITTKGPNAEVAPIRDRVKEIHADVTSTIKHVTLTTQEMTTTKSPIEEERPKTMKEILTILRKRLQNQGIPKEKITARLLKRVIKSDKKLLEMVKKSKRFRKKKKMAVEAGNLKQTNTHSNKVLHDFKSNKHTGKEKLKNDNPPKLNNQLHIKSATKSEDVSLPRIVQTENNTYHNDIKYTSQRPTTSIPKHIPRRTFPATSTVQNTVKEHPPPIHIITKDDSWNNLQEAKDGGREINIQSKMIDSKAMNNLETLSRMQDSKELNKRSDGNSNDFFNLPPPPPPPMQFPENGHKTNAFVSDKKTLKINAINVKQRPTILSRKTFDKHVQSKHNIMKSNDILASDIAESIKKNSKQRKIPKSKHHPSYHYSNLSILNDSKLHDNSSIASTTSIMLKNPRENETVPEGLDIKRDNETDLQQSVDPRSLPPFPFLLLMKPNLIKNIIGKLSSTPSSINNTHTVLKLEKPISKPVILHNETGFVYSSNESFSGIRAIHTKKGSHGVFSDLQQSGGSSQPLHLSSSGSWRRGQPNSKSNKVHKQKQGRRPAPVESGGIPIPSNFMTDRSRILNRIEKKPKKKNNLGLLRRQTGTRTIHPGVHQSSMHTSAHKSLGVMNEAKMPIVDVQSPLPNAMSPSGSALDKHTLGVAAATEAVKKLDTQIANLLKTMNEGRKLADSPIKSKSVTKSKTITASDQLSSGSDLSHLGIGTSSGSTTDLLHLGIGRPELKPRLVENKPVRPTNMETEMQRKISISPIQQTDTMPSNMDLTKISGQLSSGTQPSSTQSAGSTASSDNTGRSKSSDSGSSSNIDVNGLLNMVKFALNQPSHSAKSSPLMGQIQQLLASQTTASGQSVESPLMSQIKQVLGTISQGQGQPQVQGNTNNLLNQFLAKISPATTSTNGGSGNTLSSLLNSMTSSGGMTMNMPQQNHGMLPMTSSGMPFNLELMQSSGMPFNMGTPAGQMSMLQSVLQNEGGGDAAEMARGMGLGGGGGEGMGSLGGMFTGGMGFGGMGGLGGGMGLFGS